MHSLRDLRGELKAGGFQPELSRFYGADAPRAAGRYAALVDGFCAYYGAEEGRRACLFSTPGRTEIVGSHTDHQRGRTLAASVNLDTIAVAAPNGDGVIRIKSAGHRPAEIRLDRLAPDPGERGHSPALVRGVAARIAAMGYPVGGFDAYTTTEVLRGGGLSSSAAFEVLTATILSHLFCGGALPAGELARAAQFAENTYFGKPCGPTDQLACATGGTIALRFEGGAEPAVRRLTLDLEGAGYALCIVDSGVSHARYIAEYAAIPREMGEVARCFGREVLSEVGREEFLARMAPLRAACGDRAVLRALHFYIEDQMAGQAADAAARGDMPRFLEAVRRSGRSSCLYLQNAAAGADPRDQGLAVLMALAGELLGEEGACRIHGGGFGGTIQAFVPLRTLPRFIGEMEGLTGPGSCHVLRVRAAGTGCVVP